VRRSAGIVVVVPRYWSGMIVPPPNGPDPSGVAPYGDGVPAIIPGTSTSVVTDVG
jgi:hypothetical protein